MTDTNRLPAEFAGGTRRHRQALCMNKADLTAKAGKVCEVCEVIFRLEAGEGTTVSSLLAVPGAPGLVIRLERAGLPSAEAVVCCGLRVVEKVQLDCTIASYLTPARRRSSSKTDP